MNLRPDGFDLDFLGCSRVFEFGPAFLVSNFKCDAAMTDVSGYV